MIREPGGSRGHGEVSRVLRRRLRSRSFKRTPGRLIPAVLNLAVFCTAISALPSVPAALRPLIAVVAGHSLACVAFVAHDLSHGAVLKPSALRSALELLFWGLNLVPRTVWRRVHNETHHVHAGTPRDPDRAFLASEECASTRCYERVFYPGRTGILPINPLAFVHFVPYVLRNVLVVFLPCRLRPAIVPAAPRYTRYDRIRVALELLLILALQALLFMLAGASWATYPWAGPVPVLAASAVVMTYIFTNHFLDPIRGEAEPLLGTTSLLVPRWMDVLHGNFSHHVEHHVFPAMSPRYLPDVRRALREEYSDHYRCLRLVDAWKLLARRESFAPDPAPTESPRRA